MIVALSRTCPAVREPVVRRTTFILKYKLSFQHISHNPNAEYLEQEGHVYQCRAANNSHNPLIKFH